MTLDIEHLKKYSSFIRYMLEDNSIIINKNDKYTEYSKIVTSEEPSEDFSYRMNNAGFRSLSFDDIPDEFILTAGCSFTLGQGLPEEYRWNHLLSKKTGLPVYDISTMGIDATGIIKNITSFINKYKKPNVILIFFPMINRFKGVLHDRESRKSRLVFSQPLGGANAEELEKWINIRENLLGFFEFISEIRLLETYCRDTGIKLLWSNWDDPSCDFLDQFEFKNYIGKVGSDNIFDIKKNDNILTKKYWDWALDGRHPGILYQTHAATKFYNSM